MNKTTLLKEVNRELKRLNNRIDTMIVRGRSYEKEARRHKDLLKTLRHLDTEQDTSEVRRRSLFGKSPVRRRLNLHTSVRLFPWNFA